MVAGPWLNLRRSLLPLWCGDEDYRPRWMRLLKLGLRRALRLTLQSKARLLALANAVLFQGNERLGLREFHKFIRKGILAYHHFIAVGFKDVPNSQLPAADAGTVAKTANPCRLVNSGRCRGRCPRRCLCFKVWTLVL